MKRLALIIFFLSIVCAGLHANGDEEIKFKDIEDEKDWKEVLEIAKKKGQLIFVMVHTSWCGYCRKMEQDVYTKSKVVEYHNSNFINVKVDAETSFGEVFSSKYKVDGFPALLFLDEHEGVLQKSPGYTPARELLYYGKEALSILQKMDGWHDEFKQGKLNQDDLMSFANALSNKGDMEMAQKVADAYYKKTKNVSFNSTEAIEFASKFGNNLNSEIYQKILAQKSEIPKNEMQMYLQAVYVHSLDRAVESKDPSKIDQIIADLLPELVGVENQRDLNEMTLLTKTSYYGSISDDETYIKLIEDHYKKFSSLGAEFLFNQAYYVVQTYESAKLQDAAMNWIDKAILKDGEQFAFLVVKTFALGNKGEFKKAIEMAHKAKSIAKDKQEKRTADQIIDEMKTAAKNEN